jgi:uncharacterized repeat protein (TIGR01451 family)
MEVMMKVRQRFFPVFTILLPVLLVSLVLSLCEGLSSLEVAAAPEPFLARTPANGNKPISVVTDPKDQHSHVMTTDGDGGAIIAWVDERDGNDHAIYAQRLIGTDGQTAWAANGIPIIDLKDAPRVAYFKPSIASDGEGGAIIAWHNNDAAIYAQRVDGKGTLLWAQYGLEYAPGGTAEDVVLASDGEGGAYMVWRSTGPTLVAQRVNKDGKAQWATPVPLFTVSQLGYALDPAIISDEKGGAIVVWYDFRGGATCDIYAQRIDKNGNKLWGVDGAPVHIDTDGNFIQQNLDLVADGNGGAYVVWEDDRITTNPTLGRFSRNVFAQRLDPANGGRKWGQYGLRLSDTDLNPCEWGGGGPCPVGGGSAGARDPTVTLAGNDSIIVAWERWRNAPGVGDSSIRAQRVDSGGNLLWTGIDVKGANMTDGWLYYASGESEIAADGWGGAFVFWRANDESLTQFYDIIVQRVDKDGNRLCGDLGENISDLPDNDHTILLVPGQDTQVLAAWGHSSGSYNDIYAQLVDENCNGNWAGDSEVMIRDNLQDDGKTPSPQPWYESPDIWVRNQKDGIEQHQNPVGGQGNTVYVRAHNIGKLPVGDVQVYLYWADAATGFQWPGGWQFIGQETITSLSPGLDNTVDIPWTPPYSGHFCLFVRLVTADDPILAEGDVPGENNIAQKNVAVIELAGVRVSSPGAGSAFDSAQVSFEVVNLESEAVSADLVLERGQLPVSGTLELDLGDDLYGRWMTATGGALAGAELVPGKTAIQVTGEISGTVQGLPFEAEERTSVTATVSGPPTDQNWVYINIWERVDGVVLGGNIIRAPYLYATEATTKTASSSQVLPGEILTYTITLENHGNYDAASASLVDEIPDYLTYLTDTLTSSAGEAVFFFDRVLWNGPISLTQATQISYAVRVDGDAPASELITNAAVIEDGINPSFERSVTVEVISSMCMIYLPLVVR